MRVLVVEDEKSIAAEIAATLVSAGYVADVVRDGEEAWFRAETEDYDAIVLDLGLPRLDGMSVLKKLRTAGMLTPILILTARGSWMERVEGIDAGGRRLLAEALPPRGAFGPVRGHHPAINGAGVADRGIGLAPRRHSPSHGDP